MTTGFSIRTAIFSTVLAVALWTFVSLKASYEVVTPVRVEYILPDNHSIETEVPRSVAMKIRSTGWHLLNVLYFSADLHCVVDLSSKHSSQATVSTTELLQGFRCSVPITVIEVLSNALTVQMGTVGEKRVPLVSAIQIQAAPGRMQIGSVHLWPDSVTLRGNVALLNNIRQWKTSALSLHDLREKASGRVAMNDSLSAILQVEPTNAMYEVDIQRSAEMRVNDIPVQVIGAPANFNQIIHPTSISVYVRGGIEQLEQLGRDDIHATVEYSQLLRDTTGTVVPQIRSNIPLRVLSIQPPELSHYQRITRRSEISEATTLRRHN